METEPKKRVTVYWADKQKTRFYPHPAGVPRGWAYGAVAGLVAWGFIYLALRWMES